MSLEEKLDEFIKQYNVDREQDGNKSRGDRFENMYIILWGFALSAVGLALAATPPDNGAKMAAVIVSGIATILFSVLAVSALVKLRKYRSWRNFWGD